MKLPDGLAELWSALASSPRRLEHAMTLVFLRQLLDPMAPLIAGHDPRALVSEGLSWQEVGTSPQIGAALDTIAMRVNEIAGVEHLEVGLAALDQTAVKAAYDGASAWQDTEYFTGGDMLGSLLEHVRSSRDSSATGAFYTPYNVCYAMAMVLCPQPGRR